MEPSLAGSLPHAEGGASFSAPSVLPQRPPSFSEAGFLICPAVGGWRVIRRGTSEAARKAQSEVVYPTLLEAWEAGALKTAGGAIPQRGGFAALREMLAEGGDAGFDLALPSQLAVIEQFSLPSAEREELEGMVPLQLEKTLPYPIEEVLHGFIAGKSRELPLIDDEEEGGAAGMLAETDVAVLAIHHPAVEVMLAPLLEHGVVPVSLTLWADRLASLHEGEGAILGLWGEGEALLAGVFERGALLVLESFDSVEVLLSALPRLLLSAELAGIAMPLAGAWVDPTALDLSEHRPALSLALCLDGKRIGTIPSFEASNRLPLDFTPPSWRDRLARRNRQKRVFRKGLYVAAAYASILALALGGLFIRKQQSRRLESHLTAIRPQLDALLGQQAHWRAMSPAVDPRRYTLELMREVFESLPSPEVRVTLLEQGLGQFRVEVEAPSAAEAIAFGERLKGREALADYQFEAAQPTLTGSDKAQYRLFGKL